MTLEPDTDEELPQPQRRPRQYPRLRRAQTPILVALAIVVVVAAVLTLHRTGTTPSAAPATRTVSSSPTTAIVGPRVAASVPNGGNDPSICPSTAYCLTSQTVPGAVVRAVRAVLPGARQRFATSVVTGLGSHLWFRQVSMTAQRTNISVLIQQAGPDETLRAESDEDASSRHTFVATRSGGLTVRVVSDGPLLLHLGLPEITRLAADPRLIAVR